MEYVQLTDTELNDICNYLSNQSYIYYPIATDFFKDLYNTGCRPSELLDMPLWTYLGDNEVVLLPKKRNNPRYFTGSQLSPSLLFAIQNNISPYDGLTLRQLESVLKKILPIVSIQTENKSAIAYIFRYNLAKQLNTNGLTIEEITNTFGWSQTSIAVGYITGNIYATGKVPPVETFYITDNAGHILIDENGNYITFQ